MYAKVVLRVYVNCRTIPHSQETNVLVYQAQVVLQHLPIARQPISLRLITPMLMVGVEPHEIWMVVPMVVNQIVEHPWE